MQYRLAADIAAMRGSCMRIAQLAETGRLTASMASLAKMHNAEHCLRVVREARGLLGGNGIILEHEVARHLVDSGVVSTVEGTDGARPIVGREITGIFAFS